MGRIWGGYGERNPGQGETLDTSRVVEVLPMYSESKPARIPADLVGRILLGLEVGTFFKGHFVC